MGDFQDFVQQATQLSNILGGPSKLPEKFLKGLWDASEGGDPGGRVDRSINQLMPHLENGTVPDDTGGGGGGGDSAHKEKREKKSSPQKPPPSPPRHSPRPAGGGGGNGGADWDSFVQQGNQLSSVFGGPNRIDERYLRTLWDASEGGDPSQRVDRAINQLMSALESGGVPADTGGGGEAKKEKKYKKEKKERTKDPVAEAPVFSAPSPYPSEGAVFGVDLGVAGMMGQAWGGPLTSVESAPGLPTTGMEAITPGTWGSGGGGAFGTTPTTLDFGGGGGGGGGFGGGGGGGFGGGGDFGGGGGGFGGGGDFGGGGPSADAFGGPPAAADDFGPRDLGGWGQPAHQSHGGLQPWEREDHNDDSDTNSDNDWWQLPEGDFQGGGGRGGGGGGGGPAGGCWNPGQMCGAPAPGGSSLFCGW